MYTLRDVAWCLTQGLAHHESYLTDGKWLHGLEGTAKEKAHARWASIYRTFLWNLRSQVLLDSGADFHSHQTLLARVDDQPVHALIVAVVRSQVMSLSGCKIVCLIELGEFPAGTSINGDCHG